MLTTQTEQSIIPTQVVQQLEEFLGPEGNCTQTIATLDLISNAIKKEACYHALYTQPELYRVYLRDLYANLSLHLVLQDRIDFITSLKIINDFSFCTENLYQFSLEKPILDFSLYTPIQTVSNFYFGRLLTEKQLKNLNPQAVKNLVEKKVEALFHVLGFQFKAPLDLIVQIPSRQLIPSLEIQEQTPILGSLSVFMNELEQWLMRTTFPFVFMAVLFIDPIFFVFNFLVDTIADMRPQRISSLFASNGERQYATSRFFPLEDTRANGTAMDQLRSLGWTPYA